ncbi:MAG: preprotein translocase subunit SecG [Candidatus Omnitrophica bacterium]|nr:preprotein translocase subunit SecG [Candidatus Omnitrophota bacterium]
MMAFVITIHVIACAFLIAIVLIQRGRGGGFVSNLSGLETMFGTKTSAFLTKATTVSAVVFFITCLALAWLSIHKSKSLLDGYQPAAVTTTTTTTTEQSPASGATPAPAGTAPAAAESQAAPAAQSQADQAKP